MDSVLIYTLSGITLAMTIWDSHKSSTKVKHHGLLFMGIIAIMLAATQVKCYGYSIFN